MKKHKSHSIRDVMILIFVCASFVMVIIGRNAGWFGKTQFQNMQIARECAQAFKSILNEDSEFDRLEVEGYSGGGGTILIHGTIRETAVGRLEKLISDQSFPVEVTRKFTIVEESLWERLNPIQ